MGVRRKELTTPKRRNEVKVSLNAIFTSAPEITYERMLREDMAVGTSLSFTFDGVYLHFVITITAGSLPPRGRGLRHFY